MPQLCAGTESVQTSFATTNTADSTINNPLTDPYLSKVAAFITSHKIFDYLEI